jgi:hypothetical protein
VDRTYERGWRRRRGSPSWPSSATIPLKGIGLGIDILSLPVVIGPPGVVYRCCWPLRMMRDSTASRCIVSHIVWEFFLPMGGLPIGGWMRGIANEFKIFG